MLGCRFLPHAIVNLPICSASGAFASHTYKSKSCRELPLVICGGSPADLELRSAQKCTGFIFERTVRGELTISGNIRNNGIGIVLALVNLGQQNVSLGLICIPPESVTGALLRLRRTIQSELHEGEEVF